MTIPLCRFSPQLPHKLYGGVVPEIASRKHIEKINQGIEEALEVSGKQLSAMDAVDVYKRQLLCPEGKVHYILCQRDVKAW